MDFDDGGLGGEAMRFSVANDEADEVSAGSRRKEKVVAVCVPASSSDQCTAIFCRGAKVFYRCDQKFRRGREVR